jgi:hypothetical protein
VAIFSRRPRASRPAVWPRERPALEAAADCLNSRLAATDLLGRWEEVTGIEFRAPRYDFVLSSAIENGPNANSLGYERTLFRPGPDLAWAVQFMSHEVGTHVLIEVFRAAMPHHTFDRLYRAYECLARFYNRRVLNEPLVYTLPGYDCEDSEAQYAAQQAADPRATPADLLRSALGSEPVWE